MPWMRPVGRPTRPPGPSNSGRDGIARSYLAAIDRQRQLYSKRPMPRMRCMLRIGSDPRMVSRSTPGFPGRCTNCLVPLAGSGGAWRTHWIGRRQLPHPGASAQPLHPSVTKPSARWPCGSPRSCRSRPPTISTATLHRAGVQSGRDRLSQDRQRFSRGRRSGRAAGGADRLSPALIRERLDYWTLMLGPKFSAKERTLAQRAPLLRHQPDRILPQLHFQAPLSDP